MAANKPTAVHYTLIFFVMTTLISGVVAYLFYKDNAETQQKLVKAEQDASSATNALRSRTEDIEGMKKLIGYQFDNVGLEAQDNVNTVMGASNTLIRNYGKEQAQPTFKDTVIKLRQQIDSLETQLTNAQGDIQDQIGVNDNNMTRVRGEIETNDQARRTAEENLAVTEQTKNELAGIKDKEIAQNKQQYRTLQAEYDDFKQKAEEELKILQGKYSQLVTINQYLRGEMEKLTKIDFDNPDGAISQVDHNSRIVWINVGSDDALPLRTTFSVYQKAHHGVGQPSTQSDIKASIEVVRIIGPHMAEARIVEDDITNPIAPGDPIFTPLWSPGTTYRFSFVGKLDIDGDTTDDRALLKEVITAAGSTIDNIVDMEGNREGKGITVHTKFLVIGDIPDPNDYAPQEREKAEKVLKHLKDMREEALLSGVRIISISDFVSFMGLHTQRRMWRPGEDRPFNLKSGAASPATNQNIGNRESNGNTSQLFGPRSKRLQQEKSSGSTSKLFGRGN